MKAKKGTGSTRHMYSEYCNWPDDERWELIDGEVFAMTPAPTPQHAEVITRLLWELGDYFRKGPCKVFTSPFDVRLPKGEEEDEEVETVVQPDILIVCDERKIDKKGCRGAPDIVVEVISPSTASYDQIRKRRLYERAGVKEFWIIHPDDRLAVVFRREEDGIFGKSEYYEAESKMEVQLFPGLIIDFSQVFPPLEKKVREAPRNFRKT